MADLAERLAGLHDIRLPALWPEALIADAAAATAVGLSLALCVVLLARLLLYRPASRRRRLLEALAASRALPTGERLLAQAKLLDRLAAELEGAEASGDKEASRERADLGGRLALLDRRLRSDFFSAGPGAGLQEALYRREATVDPEEIDRALTRLLARARLP